MSLVCARAQDDLRRVRVTFEFDKAVLLPDYMDNAAALASLDTLVKNILPGEALEVTSYSSPEGRYSYNQELAGRRSVAFRNYIVEHFPYITVTVRPCGESWSELGFLIREDKHIADKDRRALLDIIDGSDDPDIKERKLRSSQIYWNLYNSYFRGLRYAEVYIALLPGLPELPHIDEPEIVFDYPEVVIPSDELDASFHVSPIEYKRVRNMIAAVKTNLLYDAVTALNVEVEVPIGNRYSVMVEDVFPWWETGNKYCFELWEMGVEGRFWFKSWDRPGMEKLRGFFAGPYVMSGIYDFQWDRSINYQGEFWSAGVTAGYSTPLGKTKRVNLEMSLSMGYMESPFRHYVPTGDYSKLLHDPARDGKFYNIFMYPTKAKVSLVVPIGVNWKKKEVKND